MINHEQIARAKINALYGEKLGQKFYKIWTEQVKLWIQLIDDQI